VWVEAADGTRLCTTLYLPAGDGPWPALIEALPYRMHDVTASYASDYVRLAGAGFAVCRVDVRGTGSSGGIASDEYPDVERTDLRTVIEWLAAQPWCTGRIGMFGTSYSGFNALHMAAEGVPELGAIVAFYATDDRYTDDVHYAGGVLRAVDLVDYVTYMVAMNALPPVPAVWGDGWEEQWRRRVDETPAWVLSWLAEQVDSPTWRRGSIRLGPGGEGYDRISCPTMIVAGWADGYRNNTFRTVERLTVPWRLLAGPWSHKDPEISRPGPNVDATAEMIAFFDEHLRGGPPSAPARAQVYVRRPARPEPDAAFHPGDWREADAWPPPGLTTRTLTPYRTDVAELDVAGDVGVTAWISCAGDLPWGQPLDQRVDDARSLTCDWALDQAAVLAGHPSVALRVRASAPVAHVAVKLCDVYPDGTSALVARGMLNLTHRGCWPADALGTRRAPEPVVPGEWMDVTVVLEATTWTLVPGHRLRLAVAGTDWPNCWPPPGPVRLGLDWSAVRVTLPIWDGSPESTHDFRPGAGPTAPDDEVVWRLEHDVLGRETRAVTRYGGRYDGEHGATVEDVYEGAVGVSTVDPGAAWARGHSCFRIAWPEARCESDVVLAVRSDAEAYDVTIELTTTRDGEPFASRSWAERIPRQLQ
jgi:predicted acyl esterase